LKNREKKKYGSLVKLRHGRRNFVEHPQSEKGVNLGDIKERNLCRTRGVEEKLPEKKAEIQSSQGGK